MLACLTTLIICNGCGGSAGGYLTLAKPPLPVAPKLHSQPTPPPPAAEAKGVWFPLADAGALKIYIGQLQGKCREDDVVIDKANEYLKRH